VDREEEIRLIIGLGNPGKAYEQTRHNVGFRIVESFAERNGFAFRHASHLVGELALGRRDGKKVMLLLPTTFMNSSGDAVGRCVSYYRVPMDQLMVVCDDIALPVGSARIRMKGSPGGHNGLKSIEAHLGTEHYARFRIGVGNPEVGELADHVLGTFLEKEKPMIEEVIQKAVAVLELWVSAGIAAAMQAANAQSQEKKVSEKKSGEEPNGQNEKTSL